LGVGGGVCGEKGLTTKDGRGKEDWHDRRQQNKKKSRLGIDRERRTPRKTGKPSPKLGGVQKKKRAPDKNMTQRIPKKEAESLKEFKSLHIERRGGMKLNVKRKRVTQKEGGAPEGFKPQKKPIGSTQQTSVSGSVKRKSNRRTKSNRETGPNPSRGNP